MQVEGLKSIEPHAAGWQDEGRPSWQVSRDRNTSWCRAGSCGARMKGEKAGKLKARQRERDRWKEEGEESRVERGTGGFRAGLFRRRPLHAHKEPRGEVEKVRGSSGVGHAGQTRRQTGKHNDTCLPRSILFLVCLGFAHAGTPLNYVSTAHGGAASGDSNVPAPDGGEARGRAGEG